jgi:hypothetical protein
VDLLREAEAATTELADIVDASLNALTVAIDAARARIEGGQARLNVKSEPKRAEHAEVVRQLNLDPWMIS